MQSTSIIGLPIRTGTSGVAPIAERVGNITEAVGTQPLPLGTRLGGISIETVQNSLFAPLLDASRGQVAFGTSPSTRDILLSELQYGMLDTAFRNELQRSSFFEMLSPSPSVAQLFSPDYRELVARLVEIQEKQFSLERLESPSIAAQSSSANPSTGFLDNTLSGIDIAVSAISANSALNQDMGGKVISGNLEPNSNTPYNHVLHDTGTTRRDHGQHKQPVRSNPRQQDEQKAQPYFEKKGRSKKNPAKAHNASAGVIKALVKGLNALSGALSRYSE